MNTHLSIIGWSFRRSLHCRKFPSPEKCFCNWQWLWKLSQLDNIRMIKYFQNCQKFLIILNVLRGGSYLLLDFVIALQVDYLFSQYFTVNWIGTKSQQIIINKLRKHWGSFKVLESNLHLFEVPWRSNIQFHFFSAIMKLYIWDQT